MSELEFFFNKAGNRNAAVQMNYQVTIYSEHSSLAKYSLPMGPVGFAVNGVPLYNAVDANEGDAYIMEGLTMDACGAHADGGVAEGQGRYHYHSVPGSACPSVQGNKACFPQIQLDDVTSDDGDVYLVGVALDGFPILVTIDNGQVVHETGTDECGGKVYDGDHYAYYMMPHFPYTLGCLRGQVGPVSGINTVRTNSKFSCSGASAATYLCYRKGGKNTEVPCLPSTVNDCSSVSCHDPVDGKCLRTLPDDTARADNWPLDV